MAKKRTVQEQEVLKDLAKQRGIVVAEILLLEKMLKANKDWALSDENYFNGYKKVYCCNP